MCSVDVGMILGHPGEGPSVSGESLFNVPIVFALESTKSKDWYSGPREGGGENIVRSPRLKG